MAFGGLNRNGGNRPMADINMIPLIDVMLVLLVIFIVTAPLLTHAVKVDLPKAASQPNQNRPEYIQLAVTARGDLYWNGERVDKTEMQRRMRAAASLPVVPELHLHADRTTQYQVLAEVMADAAKAGLGRIGFVSDPGARLAR
jgi:biopolymer transport protein ExbD